MEIDRLKSGEPSKVAKEENVPPGAKRTQMEGNKKTVNEVIVFKGFWNRKQVSEQTDKVFLFGDNTNDRLNTKHIPTSTQAVIRGLPNAIGIDTKKGRGWSPADFFTDDDFDAFKQQVDEAIQKAKDSGKIIVIPADGIGTGKAMLKEKAPKLFEYLQQELSNLISESQELEEAQMEGNKKTVNVPTPSAESQEKSVSEKIKELESSKRKKIEFNSKKLIEDAEVS